MKAVYLYDGTFEGLLSVIFQIYNAKISPLQIEKTERYRPEFFQRTFKVDTDERHSQRVLNGLRKRISAEAVKNLWKAFLSELPGIEMIIYSYMSYAFDCPQNIEEDYRNDAVLQIKQTVKMIHREVHRMHAFVRFQKTADGLYAATVKPDFDVMPLLWQHFKKRYADQYWLIYDVKRGYGAYYDGKECSIVTLDEAQLHDNKRLKENILDKGEDEFKMLWQTYFKSVNITERNNPKLHLKHVPRRYWKFLPEKGLKGTGYTRDA